MNMTTGRRGIVWKTPDITADGLKMFACITMLIQTVGIAIIEKGLIHLDQYTQESLNQAMSQDSRLMTLAGVGSMEQLIRSKVHTCSPLNSLFSVVFFFTIIFNTLSNFKTHYSRCLLLFSVKADGI